MEKRIRFISPLILVFVFASFVSGTRDSFPVQVPESLQMKDTLPVLYPSHSLATYGPQVKPPFLGTSVIGFREALAFKESRGDYFIINTLGYLGKYQFGLGTLQLLGISSATAFLEDPVLQERVFEINLARNKWILRRDIPRFVGRRINGVEVTESGVLAAAHLAGAGNVKRYLRSGGTYDVADAYGTSITDYLRAFKGYDTSSIAPRRNPRIF